MMLKLIQVAILGALLLAPGMAISAAPLFAYEWGITGTSARPGVARLEALMDRPIDGAVDFAPFNSQAIALSNLGSILNQWHAFRPAAKVAISIPVLFLDNSETFEKVAAGDLDPWLKKVADQFVASGYPDGNIRLDEEENGNWYIWACYKDPTGCKAAFAHAYKVLTTEDPKIKVWFNPSLGYSATQQSADFPGVGNLYGIAYDYYASRYISGSASNAEPAFYAAEHAASWGGGTISSWYQTLPEAIWEYGVGPRAADAFGASADDGYFVTQTFAEINAMATKGRLLQGFGVWDVNADYQAQFSDASRPAVAIAMRAEFGSARLLAILNQYTVAYTVAVPLGASVTGAGCYALTQQNGPKHWVVEVYSGAGGSCSLAWPLKTGNSNVYDVSLGSRPIKTPGAVNIVKLTLAPLIPQVVAIAGQ